jgi:hypothetical protein
MNNQGGLSTAARAPCIPERLERRILALRQGDDATEPEARIRQMRVGSHSSTRGGGKSSAAPASKG